MIKYIEPSAFGILPEKEIGKELNALFSELKSIDGAKELKLERGTYYLDSENVPKKTLYITNTIGDGEWKRGETPHLNAVGLLLEGLEDFTLDGNGSTIIIRGKMTNVAVINCRNTVLKNFNIVTQNPHMHEFKVIERHNGHIDYLLDEESEYIKDGKFYFIGKDYKASFTENRLRAWWTPFIPSDEPNAVMRKAHPFRSALSIKEIAPKTFRVYYAFAPRYKVGDAFYIFDNRRTNQGIFAEKCKNLKLQNISQHFNYGLATVFQECENIEISDCRFCPPEDGKKKIISVADFIQVCMCRGLVQIKNNYFEGAGDDCLNVHGIHFKVTKIDGNRLILKFKHRQTHGFCPFREGDSIRFISPNTLRVTDENKAIKAELKDENTVEILTEKGVDRKRLNEVVENADACPDVVFSNNTLTRIITRGILLTTSGKIVVENNKFLNTSMHSILISDDAKSWYESGFVSDALIRGNYFGRCVGFTLFVKPENRKFGGYVHSNIKFIDNTIESKNGEGGFFIKASDNVSIENNKIIGKIKENNFQNSNVTK